MKRIATALLLTIFLYNIIGYYFTFSVLDLQNRYQMSVLVQSEKNIQTIRIHKSEIKNIVFADDEKEISFNGEMYDVKSRSQEGDYIVFHCMNDKKETSLLAHLNDQVKNNMDTKSSSEKKQNTVSKNMLKDYFVSGKQNSILSSEKLVFPSVIGYRPSAILLSLSSPPPKQV